MAVFFEMMVKHPEIVQRAHVEIDNVTQQGRLPTLEDRKSIVIVDCIMKEVLRLVAARIMRCLEQKLM